LREFGAEFVFDAVAIRPGKPVVFGICQGKPIFGLPGNPVSTMVTFELFVRPAIEILSGEEPGPLKSFEAVLAETVREKPGLTHFLPAVLRWGSDWQAVGPNVSPVKWQGSGDIVAMTRANCLLMVPPERERMEAGEWVSVLPLES
jgi:molybdopterin molybdotransferase